MRLANWCFVVDTKSKQIVLAMKMRGFGVGKWNAPGGKVKEGENAKAAVIRETEEEIGIKIINPLKVADISFSFDNNPDWGQRVIGYMVEKWDGKIKETEEMLPKWFSFKNIPYDKMWEDDKYWLPSILSGKKIKGKFIFGKNDLIRDVKLKIYD